jgi:hypothetical protein
VARPSTGPVTAAPEPAKALASTAGRATRTDLRVAPQRDSTTPERTAPVPGQAKTSAT